MPRRPQKWMLTKPRPGPKKIMVSNRFSPATIRKLHQVCDACGNEDENGVWLPAKQVTVLENLIEWAHAAGIERE